MTRLEYAEDLSPAGWIVERLHPFAQDVGSIVPEGFEAYARIFHPAGRRDGDQTRPVRWREIAENNLRVFHPEVQFPGLVGGDPWNPTAQPPLWDEAPRHGTMPIGIARALVELLRPRTTIPRRCWFAAWEGWGDPVPLASSAVHVTGGLERAAQPLTPPPGVEIRARPRTPTFSVPQRSYYLATGPIEAALETVYGTVPFYQSANLWWPDDRLWCVATEIDFEWTYVGGTRDCIDQVLGHPELEALPAKLTDGVTWASDRLNPQPIGGSERW